MRRAQTYFCEQCHPRWAVRELQDNLRKGASSDQQESGAQVRLCGHCEVDSRELTASSSRTRWTLWRSTFRGFKRKQGQRNVPNLRLRKHKLLRPLKRRRRVGSRELWRPATARPAVPCARKQLRNDIYRYTLEKSTFFSHIGLKPEGSPMSVEGQSQLKSFWGATSNRSIEVSWSLDSCKVRSAAGFMTCRFQAWEIAEKSFPAFLTASVWAEYMHQPFVS